MDRRDFLKTAGLGATALGVAACTPGTGVTATTGQNGLPAGGRMAENVAGIGLLGYGCMRWPMVTGDDGVSRIDQEEVNRLVDYALEHGVNYFDTSPNYLGGKSEEATSIALNRHPREEWLLATKLSNFSDWSYDNSVLMYRNSLEVFKTDHIDYYLLHSIGGMQAFDTRFGSTGIMDFLMRERERGNIRNLGFSFHGDQEGFDELMSLHSRYHWDFVQIQMNYVDWRHAGRNNTNAEYLYGVLDRMEIPVVIMEPLRGGRLADMPVTLADMLLAKDPEGSLASWAFRFAGSFPRVLTVLSGMTYMEHLEDNLRTYLDFKPLSDEEMELLQDVATRMETYPLVRCTGCNYCMPCPYGIDIPGIFKFYNDNLNAGTYVKSSEQEAYARTRRRYLLAYDKAIPTVRQADHCIRCGRCEEACPQHLNIRQELGKIDEYIESLRQETL